MIGGAETSDARSPHVPWWWTDLLHRLERPPRYQPLVLIALAFISGIAADRWADGRISLFVWGAILVCGLAAWYFCYRCDRFRLSSIALLLAYAAMGGAREYIAWRNYAADEISR